jgi:hypothetical protein
MAACLVVGMASGRIDLDRAPGWMQVAAALTIIGRWYASSAMRGTEGGAHEEVLDIGQAHIGP